jgi:arsenate reductase (glutaredoxin)
MITIYGIKNCDTMKKAFQWLNLNEIEYTFHDYKKDGVDESILRVLIEKMKMEELINMRGTTWKQLDEEQRLSIVDKEAALELMKAQPSMIKRPIVEKFGQFIVGFDEKQWALEF